MHVLAMSKLERDRREELPAGNDAMIVDARSMFAELVEWQAALPVKEYEKFNRCPVCMCELFPEPFCATDLKVLAD